MSIVIEVGAGILVDTPVLVVVGIIDAVVVEIETFADDDREHCRFEFTTGRSWHPLLADVLEPCDGGILRVRDGRNVVGFRQHECIGPPQGIDHALERELRARFQCDLGTGRPSRLI